MFDCFVFEKLSFKGDWWATWPEAIPSSTFQYLRPWSDIAQMALRLIKIILKQIYAQREILPERAQISFNDVSIIVVVSNKLRTVHSWQYSFIFPQKSKKKKPAEISDMKYGRKIVFTLLFLFSMGSSRWIQKILQRPPATSTRVSGKFLGHSTMSWKKLAICFFLFLSYRVFRFFAHLKLCGSVKIV